MKLNEHDAAAKSVDLIIKGSICKKTLDNVTVILIAFDSFMKENTQVKV